MASCTQLAETLGVTGFAEKLKMASPSKKRKSTELNKENIASLTLSEKKHSASEPVNSQESSIRLKQSAQQVKRRKIHSLDNVVTPPPAFKSPKSLQKTPTKSPLNSPVKKSHNHSCPVESPIASATSATASAVTLPRASMLNNVNFNSVFPSMRPEELAFQGASILQNLALWMEQEQKKELGSHGHAGSGKSKLTPHCQIQCCQGCNPE